MPPVVVGAIVVGISFRIEPGSTGFYPATLALALVWAVDGFAFGPLHLGRTAAARTLCSSAWDLPGCSC